MSGPDYSHWFDTSAGMGRVTTNNDTTLFTTGEDAFEDLGDRLEFDAGDGAQFYLLGWSFTKGLTMRSSSATPDLLTMDQLLRRFAQRGGAIRAMLWDNKLIGNSGTGDGVAFVNSLPGGQAILDHRTALAGAHHQKIQVVVAPPDPATGTAAPVAYCGGMDVFEDRVGPKSLHDVHCKIVGDAAVDVANVVLERWNDHPDRRQALTPKLASLGSLGNDSVQVCRTYPQFRSATAYGYLLNKYGEYLQQLVQSVKSLPIGDMRDAGQTRYYNFYEPALGVQQIWRAARKAIRQARRYIYLEEQYLTNKWIGDELARKLAGADKNFRIVILALHPDLNTDIPQMWPRRRDLLSGLRAVDPGQTRWKVAYRRLDMPHSYVHSKTWIFDDELVITGSANADRRGFTYSSEADVVVAGVLEGARASRFGARTVAQDLRCRLFAKHLGGSPGMYLDPKQALGRWFAALTDTQVAPFNPDQRVGDPDSYVEALRAAAEQETVQGQQARLVLGLLRLVGGPENFFWDNFEDPDAGVNAP